VVENLPHIFDCDSSSKPHTSLRVHRLQQLFQAGSESRSVGLDLSRQPPSAGQAPLAVLRGSLGLAYVQLSCVTDVDIVCVVERYDLTELKEYYYYYAYESISISPPNCRSYSRHAAPQLGDRPRTAHCPSQLDRRGPPTNSSTQSIGRHSKLLHVLSSTTHALDYSTEILTPPATTLNGELLPATHAPPAAI